MLTKVSATWFLFGITITASAKLRTNQFFGRYNSAPKKNDKNLIKKIDYLTLNVNTRNLIFLIPKIILISLVFVMLSFYGFIVVVLYDICW